MPRIFGSLNKPPVGSSIMQGHPLASDLLACFLINELGGPIVDLVSGNSLAFTGSGARANSRVGHSLDTTGNDSGAKATAWQNLRNIPEKITLLWRGTIGAAPSAFSFLGGVTNSNADASPFHCYSLLINSAATGYQLHWNSGGVSATLAAASGTAFGGEERQVVGVLKGNSGACGLFEAIESPRHVTLNSSAANFGANFGATAQVGIGSAIASLSRNLKGICRHFYIWKRILNLAEMEELWINPYSFIATPKRFYITIPTVSLTQTFSDQMNNMSDAVSLVNQAAAAYGVVVTDSLNFLADSLSIVGGDPDYQLVFADSMFNLSDSQRILVGLIKTFSDSVNNWIDAVSLTVGIPIQVFDSNQYNWADDLVVALRAPYTLTFSDTMSMSDAAIVERRNRLINITAEDTMNFMADAVRIYSKLRVVLSDNFVMSDSLRMRFLHLLHVADILTGLADSPLLKVNARPAFADDMNNMADAVSIALTAVLRKTVADSMNTMSDSVSLQLSSPYDPDEIARVRRYLNDTVD